MLKLPSLGEIDRGVGCRIYRTRPVKHTFAPFAVEASMLTFQNGGMDGGREVIAGRGIAV
jgi:hypothetical protein